MQEKVKKVPAKSLIFYSKGSTVEIVVLIRDSQKQDVSLDASLFR